MKLRVFLIFATLLFTVGVSGQTNLALNRAITISGFNDAKTNPEGAIDGKLDTYFYGVSADNPSGRGQGEIKIDLGMSISIRSIKVVLSFQSWSSASQEIAISSNGVNWGLISGNSVTALPYSATFWLWENTLGKVETRFIRFRYTNNSSIAVLNLKVFEITVAPDDEPNKINYAYDGRGCRVSRTITLVPGNKSFSIFDSTGQALKKEFIPENTFTDGVGESKVSIYPNPTRGELVVQVTNPSSETARKIMLYDLSGALIYKRENASEYTDVDITDSPSGTYILKIFNGDASTTWKIIKQ